MRNTALEKGQAYGVWRATTATTNYNLRPLSTRLTHTLTVKDWQEAKCVYIYVIVLFHYYCPIQHAKLSTKYYRNVKSKKNQSEFYFQNDSQGSSTDPFPGETSITHEIYLKHLTI